MHFSRCICDPGYELSRSGRSCEDIDECLRSPCRSGDCVNTDGGFDCACQDGFTLGPDGRTCADTVLAPCYAVARAGRWVDIV